MPTDLAFDLESLAVDVFTLDDEDTVLESLTGLPGGTEIVAACTCSCSCSGFCSIPV